MFVAVFVRREEEPSGFSSLRADAVVRHHLRAHSIQRHTGNEREVAICGLALLAGKHIDARRSSCQITLRRVQRTSSELTRGSESDCRDRVIVLNQESAGRPADRLPHPLQHVAADLFPSLMIVET